MVRRFWTAQEIDPSRRAETLSVEEFTQLATLLRDVESAGSVGKRLLKPFLPAIKRRALAYFSFD